MSGSKKSKKKQKATKKENAATKRELLEAMYGMKLGDGDGDAKKPHKFWNTQPVPQDDEVVSADEHGPVEVKTLDQVMKDCYPMPKAFKWVDIDVTDEKERDEVYELLTDNYVEDDENMFRFDYSREFLMWALTPPDYKKAFHVGVRVVANNKLVGFISGIPACMKVYEHQVKCVEINFLCVHKKLRAKRLAPVLIKEITRRVNLTDTWQAVYTAGVVLPKPVARNQYYHRSLNPKKLIDIGFSRLQRNMTMTRTIKRYALPSKPQSPGLRPMIDDDCPKAAKLLQDYLNKFSLAQQFTLEEFKHWLLPRPNVISTYIVEQPNGDITDMISFYALPSHVIGNQKYKLLRAAYSFYNVSTTVAWKDLMYDALILAKNEKFDVFNALNVMENDSFLEHLKFGKGDGHLQYYIYNWRCPEMPPSQVALVLL